MLSSCTAHVQFKYSVGTVQSVCCAIFCLCCSSPVDIPIRIPVHNCIYYCHSRFNIFLWSLHQIELLDMPIEIAMLSFEELYWWYYDTEIRKHYQLNTTSKSSPAWYHYWANTFSTSILIWCQPYCHYQLCTASKAIIYGKYW